MGGRQARLELRACRLAAAFAVVVDSLEAETEADLGTSIEIPNAGLVVGPSGGEVMYAIDGSTPELTEFRLTSDDTFEACTRGARFRVPPGGSYLSEVWLASLSTGGSSRCKSNSRSGI